MHDDGAAVDGARVLGLPRGLTSTSPLALIGQRHIHGHVAAFVFSTAPSTAVDERRCCAWRSRMFLPWALGFFQHQKARHADAVDERGLFWSVSSSIEAPRSCCPGYSRCFAFSRSRLAHVSGPSPPTCWLISARHGLQFLIRVFLRLQAVRRRSCTFFRLSVQIGNRVRSRFLAHARRPRTPRDWQKRPRPAPPATRAAGLQGPAKSRVILHRPASDIIRRPDSAHRRIHQAACRASRWAAHARCPHPRPAAAFELLAAGVVFHGCWVNRRRSRRSTVPSAFAKVTRYAPPADLPRNPPAPARPRRRPRQQCCAPAPPRRPAAAQPCSARWVVRASNTSAAISESAAAARPSARARAAVLLMNASSS